MLFFISRCPMTLSMCLRLFFLVLLIMGVSACTYLKYAAVQKHYARIQNIDPSQVNLKHMLDRDTYFVYGKIISENGLYANTEMAVAAYSDKFKKRERVDTMFLRGTGTHYGLNLPEGRYSILVFADINNNKIFENTEVVSKNEVNVNNELAPDKILSRTNLKLSYAQSIKTLSAITRKHATELSTSFYYPTGTIRSINDPIFDDNMSILGMYDPASFLENAPTMFYALEEDTSYKVPVIFVHGIGGNIRSFSPIIEKLDPQRFKAWFFYYPSGGDLDQLASFFYDIFLSGNVIGVNEMPMVVVSHSMGGLVVREALNKYENKAGENKVKIWASLASPLGGLSSAEKGVKHGIIVLPSWRDLNHNGEFISRLYRKPLPDFVDHSLYYAYEDSNNKEAGDGVVPLASQLHASAKADAYNTFGVHGSHTSILEDNAVIQDILAEASRVKNIFPDSHLEIIAKGGFDIGPYKNYSPRLQHAIQNIGKYVIALADGDIQPFHPKQKVFLRVLEGEAGVGSAIDKEYARFVLEYRENLKREQE